MVYHNSSFLNLFYFLDHSEIYKTSFLDLIKYPSDHHHLFRFPKNLLLGGENSEGGGERGDVRVVLRERAAERLPDRHKSLHRSKQNALRQPQIRFYCLMLILWKSLYAFSTFSYLQERQLYSGKLMTLTLDKPSKIF